MEPIKINVNVEVNLGQATLEAIKAVFGPQIVSVGPQINLEEQRTETKPKKTKKPEPQGADPEGTGAEDIGDLPPDDAPAPTPKPQPTEADARNAVQAARKRGVSAATIKAFMKDCFGIATSVECPAERRQALIDGLNNLAA